MFLGCKKLTEDKIDNNSIEDVTKQFNIKPVWASVLLYLRNNSKIWDYNMEINLVEIARKDGYGTDL